MQVVGRVHLPPASSEQRRFGVSDRYDVLIAVNMATIAGEQSYAPIRLPFGVGRTLQV